MGKKDEKGREGDGVWKGLWMMVKVIGMVESRKSNGNNRNG